MDSALTLGEFIKTRLALLKDKKHNRHTYDWLGYETGRCRGSVASWVANTYRPAPRILPALAKALELNDDETVLMHQLAEQPPKPRKP